MKKLLIIGVLLLGLVIVSTPVFAKKGKSGQAGKSNKAHLYLYEKYPYEPWNIVEDGAWGKMTYDLSGEEFKFVFNGHDLVPEMEYTLIYYPDPWPGKGLICLGEGTADEYGDVHIKNSSPITENLNKAKIWLVLSDDVECEEDDENMMLGWTPEEYLFEFDLINFDYTGTFE